MFDRYEHHAHSTADQYVTVTEKRAPTDESVRLLKEMEQAARDKIVQSIRLENGPLDCVIHWQDNAMSCHRDYFIIAKINGQRVEVRKSLDAAQSLEDVAIKLRDALAERISQELLSKAFSTIGKSFYS